MAGPHEPERVYLDSSVWLAWFDDEHGHPAIRRVLEWAETGQLQLLVSPLHPVESLGRRPGQPTGERDPAADVEESLTSGPMTLVEFDVRVALVAQRLRLSLIIGPVADSVHLAHAIVARADVIFTLDADDFPLQQAVEGVYVA